MPSATSHEDEEEDVEVGEEEKEDEERAQREEEDEDGAAYEVCGREKPLQ